MSLPVRALLNVTVVAAALALSACGGGGKGDAGGGSGSGLAISPSSLAFSADQNAPLPSAQSIQITISDPSAAYVVAGYPPGTSVPSWLNLSLSGTGSSWSVRVAITGTGLAPGTYSATVRVVIANGSQQPIASRDAQVTYVVSSVLKASPGSLAFAVAAGGPAPAAQNVSLSGTGGLAWTASADQAWVSLAASSGTTPSSVPVSVNPAGLAPGSYSANITFSAAGKTATVGVSLTVSAPALQTSQATLSFNGVNGAPVAPQSLNVSMNNATSLVWSATSAAGWLVLSKTSGTTPDTVSVSVNPAVGLLASGTYSSTVTFTASSGGSPLSATVNVSLTLTKATFSSAPSTLVLGGANGLDMSAVPFQLALTTGANAYTFTATPSATWMTVSSAATTTSATPVTVTVTPNRTGLTGGTRTGSVAFSATVNGDTIAASLPVTFNLEAHKLLVTANGVALTSAGTLSRLTRTVRVTDNLGLATPWSATSDQTWLTVTSSGLAGGDLVLTANPSGLAANALYQATVSITSSDATVENLPETVRVGLWIGATTPGPVSVAGTFTEAVTDPVRPYVYVHSGGTNITAYNVHTGATVGTIANVVPSLGGMAVASDGTKLFAIDKANARIVSVSLPAGLVGSPWNLATAPTVNTYPRVAYMRTNGVPVLAVTDGAIHSAIDGSVLLTFAPAYLMSSSVLVTTSLQGKAFCWGGCQSLTSSALAGGTFSTAQLKGGGASSDIALSADGSHVYGASGWPYYWTSTDTATGQVTLLGSNLPYPNNVEVGPDARIYGGRSSALPTQMDVYVYDNAGTQLAAFKLASALYTSILDRQLVISGDGLRAIGLTDEPALKIVTTP